MQLSQHYEDGIVYHLDIPDATEEVMPNVLWGEVSRLYSPAFWKFICSVKATKERADLYKLGSSLREEVVACLLGGYGVPGELSTGAFHHLKEKGLFESSYVTAQQIENLLLEPIMVGDRFNRYRYPRQKAKFIAHALSAIDSINFIPENPIDLRNWLIGIPGIGLKTASWIVRNWMDADCVAIIDIHIHRAGVLAGFYLPDENVQRNYSSMEERFVTFARSLGVSASVLDNQIWNEMRSAPGSVRNLLEMHGVTSKHKCGLPPRKKARTPTGRFIRSTQNMLFA